MEIILNSVEVRVLGSLIEKEHTTPEYYPLTLNSLVNACNQKSNREPVTSYDEQIVEKALATLRDKQFARRVTGTDMRVPKYKQIFSEEMKLTVDEIAIMCILLLRGPQTVGEIKVRTARIFNFDSLINVEETLDRLAARESPFVMKLIKQAGMKESRYSHLLSGEPTQDSFLLSHEDDNNNMDRLTKLEQDISLLKSEYEYIKSQLIELKKLIE